MCAQVNPDLHFNRAMVHRYLEVRATRAGDIRGSRGAHGVVRS